MIITQRLPVVGLERRNQALLGSARHGPFESCFTKALESAPEKAQTMGHENEGLYLQLYHWAYLSTHKPSIFALPHPTTRWLVVLSGRGNETRLATTTEQGQASEYPMLG